MGPMWPHGNAGLVCLILVFVGIICVVLLIMACIVEFGDTGTWEPGDTSTVGSEKTYEPEMTRPESCYKSPSQIYGHDKDY